MPSCFLIWSNLFIIKWHGTTVPESKVHGTNMGPTWVLSAPDGPHFGPMNLAIRGTFGWDKRMRSVEPWQLYVMCSRVLTTWPIAEKSPRPGNWAGVGHSEVQQKCRYWVHCNIMLIEALLTRNSTVGRNCYDNREKRRLRRNWWYTFYK